MIAIQQLQVQPPLVLLHAPAPLCSAAVKMRHLLTVPNISFLTVICVSVWKIQHPHQQPHPQPHPQPPPLLPLLPLPPQPLLPLQPHQPPKPPLNAAAIMYQTVSANLFHATMQHKVIADNLKTASGNLTYDASNIPQHVLMNHSA